MGDWLDTSSVVAIVCPSDKTLSTSGAAAIGGAEFDLWTSLPVCGSDLVAILPSSLSSDMPEMVN